MPLAVVCRYLRRDHVARGLLDDLAAITTPHERHPLTHVKDRLLDRPPMRRLDLLPLPRVPQRPTRQTRTSEH
jgi:hypothetical protein